MNSQNLYKVGLHTLSFVLLLYIVGFFEHYSWIKFFAAYIFLVVRNLWMLTVFEPQVTLTPKELIDGMKAYLKEEEDKKGEDNKRN